MKKVGAQRPTKIPKRSACACDSAVSSPVRNQIAIDPMMEAKPKMKLILLNNAHFCEFIFFVVDDDEMILIKNDTSIHTVFCLPFLPLNEATASNGSRVTSSKNLNKARNIATKIPSKRYLSPSNDQRYFTKKDRHHRCGIRRLGLRS